MRDDNRTAAADHGRQITPGAGSPPPPAALSRIRQRMPVRRVIAVSAVLLLLAGFVVRVALPESPYRPDTPERVESVAGDDFVAAQIDLPDDQAAGSVLTGDQAYAFPSPGSRDVELTAGRRVRVTELGVSVRPIGRNAPGSVRIALASASVAGGLRWTVARTDGSSEPGAVEVVFDYNDYRHAAGADWDDRLTIYDATGAEIDSDNDAAAGTLTADITLAPTIGGAGATASVIVTSSVSGDNGSFAATSLGPAASWSAGNPTGDFSWSYPIDVPSSLGGLDPSIALAYSSSAVDGRNEATNNQPSIVGEGFSFHPGFIERKYTACQIDDEDGANNPANTGGDRCWRTDNAFLSLNGGGGELIRDDSTGQWRVKNDDSSKVEKLTGATNGDDNGEYWRVTTAGGVEYYFGLNRLPGYGTGDAETDSTSTVPVFGNHSGEPCHDGDFDDSWCDQAWRWSLDWVVDTHGNAIAYFYDEQTNHYLLNLDDDNPVAYDRAAHLSSVDYGLRAGDAYTGATHRVDFTHADRCVPGATCDYDHPENWPDTPLDQACDGSVADCAEIYTPAFFTDQRLASITTEVDLDGTWTGVDTWTLRHSWPDPGDSTRAGLWLEGIQHTGLAGDTPLDMPEITFDGVQLSNRVQKTLDTRAPMNWFRISAIHNGTGGVTTVNYSDAECDAKSGGVMPSSPEDNDMLCMPVITTTAEDNGGTPEYDWYHKYLVTEVADIDTVGGSPPVTTSYEYLGDPAWRFTDDDGLTDPEYKTWSQYRGYGRVRTVTGDGSDDLLVSETTFFRGLHGQKLPDGSTTSVQVDGVTDHDEFAGRPRTERSYLDGQVLSETTHTPWRSAPTATRVRDWGTTHARHTGTSDIEARSRLSDGSWRTVATETTYDSWGMAVETESSGDLAVSGDEQCVTITYARNTSAWIVNLPVRTETVSTACDATPAYPDDLISDERVYYDGSTSFGTPPTKGDITRTEVAKDYTNGTPDYLVTGKVTVDQYGRGLASIDVDGNVTNTQYVPATGGPLTHVITTNPLGHTSTQILDPLRGHTLKSVDANSNVTEMEYDALGRLVAGWSPDRPSTGWGPAATFEYHLNDDAPSATVTHGINANSSYTTTIELFDGLLRPRQTQIPAPDGGRILSDTFYDTRGLVHKRHGAYFHQDAPSTTLFAVSDNTVPGTTSYEYDTAGRVTAEVFHSFGVERHRSTTVYDGEELTVIDPDGRAATSVVDARGNRVELRNLHTSDPAGAYDATTYTYDHADRLTSMTDPAGNTWSHEYDLLGRKTATVDPDTGRTEKTYYDNGLVESVTDSRGESTWYEYDELGRPIFVMKDDFFGELVEAYEYDLFGLGLPAVTYRWDEGGDLYRTRILAYDDANRPIGIRYTLPNSLGDGLGRSFDFRYEYKRDGSVSRIRYPSAGGLPLEDVITTYSDLGLPLTTFSAKQWYVSESLYTKFAEIAQLTFDPDGPNASAAPVAWQAFTYEDGTRRVTGSTFQKSSGPNHVVTDLTYGYTEAGLITSIDNQSDFGADTQCFVYDYLKRVTEAWTGATPAACDTAPTSPGQVSGAAPYWQSWTFDNAGNRSGQVDHLAGETIDYTYSASQPHTVTSAKITKAQDTTTLSYAYDSSGNTVTRPDGSGSAQTLSWSFDGKLETVEAGDDVTEYRYTAGGNRITRTDPDGTVTAFLPGMEVVKDPSGTVTASRYYTHGGQPVAVRTDDDSLHWLASDHQGTTTATVESLTHQTDVRHHDLYGNERGTPPMSWVDDHGFLGGVKDPVGLTHLGARLYDPLLGRFISADPLIDVADSQQMGGYAYANHSPVSFADPSGLFACIDGDCSYHNADGSVRTDCADYVGTSKACGRVDAVSRQLGLELEQIDEDVVEDAEKARDILNTSVVDVVIDVGADILLDLIGVNDIMSCVGSGDMWACASMLMDLIPWTKIVKLGAKLFKAAKKIYKAVTSFQDKLAWARQAMNRYDSAVSAAWDRAKRKVAAQRANTPSCDVGNSFTTDTRVLLADGTSQPIDEIAPGDKVLAADETTGQTAAREVVTTIKGTGQRTLIDIGVDTDSDGHTDATITATDQHPIWATDPATPQTPHPATETQLSLVAVAAATVVADPAASADGSGSGGGGPPAARTLDPDTPTGAPTPTSYGTKSGAAAGTLPGRWVNAIDLSAGQLLHTSHGTWTQITSIDIRTAHTTVHNLTITDLHTYHVLAEDTPVLTHNCNNVISNADGYDNAGTLATHGNGTAFSGVYEPSTGNLRAHLSVDPDMPNPPLNPVRRLGGHGQINFEHFGGSRETVGFTMFVEEGGLSVGWTSRSVNGRNHGNALAPIAARQSIMDALIVATGRNAWSR